MNPQEIWSGGQTGVDRAAWDAARRLGIPTRGWVPRGRRAEDGTVPQVYGDLRETPSSDYAQRTRWNVRDTDATLILCRGPLHGGSALTLAEAERLGRPVLVVDLSIRPPREAAERIRRWLANVAGTCLNVAGPRITHTPRLYLESRELLTDVLSGDARRARTPPS